MSFLIVRSDFKIFFCVRVCVCVCMCVCKGGGRGGVGGIKIPTIKLARAFLPLSTPVICELPVTQSRI